MISCIEVPLFLITHPKIFKNDILYVFWIWSFGHTVSGIDYASRLYYPHRISLIYIPHSGSNKYVPLCFQHNIDVFVYKSIIPSQKIGHVDVAKYYVLRFFIMVITAFFSKKQAITFFDVYRTISMAENKLQIGIEEKNILVKDADWTGYIRLLREKIGRNPCLPNNLINICKTKISQKYRDFSSKPFVVLLLRSKGISGDLNSSFRSSGCQLNYIAAVKYLTANGYHVVGTGETQHSHFKNINGYFQSDNVDLDKKLLNVFLLTNCSLFIGQMSGSYILPSSCGILCLLCDVMSYRLGAFGDQNIVLYKHLRDGTTEKILSIVDIFRNHQDLAFGYNFKKKNVLIEPNTSDEILEAIKECVEILEGKFHMSDEDKLLCEKFKQLPSPEMHLYYQQNRMPMFVLRKMKEELLK
ncbi:TIGR04372 family glycosyltransferase [Candidatus Peregrinibacteria bacterium]|nr:TIGR04372 family glycosyltransferase [Candidatus Peregrinibacteria bacterium]